MAVDELELLSLRRAASLVPSIDGEPVHAKTIRRWIRSGVGGTRLPARRIGARIGISRADLDTFLREVNREFEAD